MKPSPDDEAAEADADAFGADGFAESVAGAVEVAGTVGALAVSSGGG
jgi:hypothetical protein